MFDRLATIRESPFHWNGREGQAVRFVVLHGTAGGGAVEWFQNPASNVSAQYVIKQDGSIVGCVDEDDASYANGFLSDGHAAFWDTLGGINPNLVSISVEHEHFTSDNSDPLTPAQEQASFGLIQRICERHSIPMQVATAQGGICGHVSLDPVSRQKCPGNYPWGGLWAALQPHQTPMEEIPVISLSNPEVSKYYEVNGDAWQCRQNGHVIGHAILDFYRLTGGATLCGLTDLGLPGTDEIALGSTATLQVFERGIVLYDPQFRFDRPPGARGPVYKAHLFTGAGLDIIKRIIQILPAQPQNDPAKDAQIAQLKARLAQIEELTKL